MTDNENTPLTNAKDITVDVLYGLGGGFLVIGSAIASVRSGSVLRRYGSRLDTALEYVDGRLNQLKTQVNRSFVSSDEFEDLLVEALQRLAIIRDEARRQYYADFIVGMAVQGPDQEAKTRRVLRTLDELQPADLQLLFALNQAPATMQTLYNDPSYGRTLRFSDHLSLIGELTDASRQEHERLYERIEELRGLRLLSLDLEQLKRKVSAPNPELVKGWITVRGREVLEYLKFAE